MQVLLVLCIATIPASLNGQSQTITPDDSKAVEHKDVGPKQEEKKLSEIQKLKAENFLLKVELTKTRATLQDRENRLLSIELSNEQSKLVEEFKKELNAANEAVFNWESLTFKLPDKK